MFDIWEKCDGKKNITNIRETAWRIVELQEKTSTRKLVDSLTEQKILDTLIEESKPMLLQAYIPFHPLLYTPFRYPPLKNGSRFGKKIEPSLWYGSINFETTMAEKAYYQLAFVNASHASFGMVVSPMTLFSVKINILKGIELNEPPFLKYKDQISSPISYENSQFLGRKMRENNIDGFKFISARDLNQGINIGLFNMHSFASKQPNAPSFQTWQCNTTKTNVEFVKLGSNNDHVFIFNIQDFTMDGIFPLPFTSG